MFRKLLTHSQFPPPENASSDGLLCFGGDLDVETLVDAYFHGIFPWPHEGYPLLWFFPQERGILEFRDLHVPQSLQKLIKKNKYTFKINTDFEEIIVNCSKAPRKDQKGTWITEEMRHAYVNLNKSGHVLSLSCYNQDKKMVGGIYGVFLAGVFSGESMFGIENNVSKLCVVELVKYLSEKKLKWIDIQMVTPVMELLGGKYVSRTEYLELLKRSHKEYLSFSQG